MTLSVRRSQFIEKGFKKAENSEQNVVLLLFLFSPDTSVTVHWERFPESRKFWTECGATVVFVYARYFSHSSLRKVSRKPNILNRMWSYCCFYLHQIIQSQFIEKGFQEDENSEQNVVLLLFLFTLDLQSQFIEKGFKKDENSEQNVCYCCFY